MASGLRDRERADGDQCIQLGRQADISLDWDTPRAYATSVLGGPGEAGWALEWQVYGGAIECLSFSIGQTPIDADMDDMDRLVRLSAPLSVSTKNTKAIAHPMTLQWVTWDVLAIRRPEDPLYCTGLLPATYREHALLKWKRFAIEPEWTARMYRGEFNRMKSAHLAGLVAGDISKISFPPPIASTPLDPAAFVVVCAC